MENMHELTNYVSEKAKQYIEETGTKLEKFPISIVDFVIEYVTNSCHFPKHFTERELVYILERGKNSLVMACVEVYAKAGAEGQSSHAENSISRSYQSAWITFDLISYFPNYIEVIL